MDNQQVTSTYVLTDGEGRFYIGSHTGSMGNYWGSSSDRTFKPKNKHILYSGVECISRMLERNLYKCWNSSTKIVNRTTPQGFLKHPRGMLGKKQSKEHIELRRGDWLNNNPMYNEQSKKKHLDWTNSQECSDVRSKQCSGSGNPNSKSVIYLGEIFLTIKDFTKQTGISNYRLKKLAIKHPETIKIVRTSNLNDYPARE